MRAGWTAALFVAAFGAGAQAYVPDSTAVFHRYAERMAKVHPTAAKLAGEARFGPADAPASSAAAELDLSFPGPCRIVLDRSPAPVEGTLRAGVMTGDLHDAPAAQALLVLGCPLVSAKGATLHEAEAAVARFAKRLGVNVATVSLAWLGDHAAIVVGAGPRDLERPQIWFDERSGLPVRVVGTVAGRRWDVRLEQPASMATAGAAPRRWLVSEGSRQVLALTLMLPESAEAPTPGATSDVDDRPEE